MIKSGSLAIEEAGKTDEAAASSFFIFVFFCLLSGCGAHGVSEVKRDLIVLLPEPDGKGGAVTVTTKGGSQIVDHPGYATEVEGSNKPPTSPKLLEEKQIKDIFGPALAAQPDPLNRFMMFIVYFEHDTTKLTDESKGLLPEVLRTIKTRSSNEVYVVGHTDLVGTEAYNIQLSSRRANYIRNWLISSGVKPGILFILFYGKARPLVPTEDEVSEPRNRRVEVIVR